MGAARNFPFRPLSGLGGDLTVCARVTADKSASHVNESALASTLVFKACGGQRKQSCKADVFRVDEISGGCSRHTGRVAVDDVHDTEVGVVKVHREGNLLIGSRLSNLIRLRRGRAFRTGVLRDNALESASSNKREVVDFAVNREDRTNDVVEVRFGRGGRRHNRGRRGAIGRRNIRRTCGVNPVAKTAKRVGSASTVLNATVVRRADGGFDVPLDFPHALGFRLSDVGGANARNGVLQVRNKVVTTEDLDVVAKTRTAGKLVIKRGDVGTLGDTSRCGRGKAVNRPFVVGGGSLGLRAERKQRGFFGGKDSQDVGQILTVGDGCTNASLGGRSIRLISG